MRRPTDLSPAKLEKVIKKQKRKQILISGNGLNSIVKMEEFFFKENPLNLNKNIECLWHADDQS